MDPQRALAIQRARRLSAESSVEFREAHQRGMDNLRHGDVRGLLRSIDEELNAISKQQQAIELLVARRRAAHLGRNRYR